MDILKKIQRNVRSIKRLQNNKIKIYETAEVLNKEWELERYETKLRKEFEKGKLTEGEFDRLLDEKEAEIMLPKNNSK